MSYPIVISGDTGAVELSKYSNVPTLGVAALGIFIGGSLVKQGPMALIAGLIGGAVGGYLGSKLNSSLQTKG